MTLTESHITRRLHIGSDLYAELFFETGCAWIEGIRDSFNREHPGNPLRVQSIFSIIQRSPLFWAWWEHAYEIADRDFLVNGVHTVSLYKKWQETAPREMPANISIKLIQNAKRHRISENEVKQAGDTAERTYQRLNKNFDEKTYRELNILNNSIEVTENRLNGDFNKTDGQLTQKGNI